MKSTCFGEIQKKMEPNKRRSHTRKRQRLQSSGGKLGADIGKKAFGVKSLTIGGYDSQCIRISLRLRPKRRLR